VILRPPANALDPRMRTYWLVESLLATAAAVAITVVAAGVTALAGAVTAAWIVAVVGGLVVVALAVSAFVTPRLDYEHYRYEVTALGLYVARGWLWRSWQIVPHARVQTVDTTAGPLLRAFGLVAVQVATASASGSPSIPGLRPEVADALVEELARMAGIEEGT
jgi:membrane protein YdbS with pleckstrin-like domain